MTIDLNLLGVLDAVLQAGSVTGAADRLGITVSAASRAIDRLREQVGDPVLVRAGRGMVLTPRAQAMRSEARALLESTCRLLSTAPTFDLARLRRRFVIRATDALIATLGCEVDRLLRVEAPEVTLQYLPPAADDAAALREGNADLTVGRYGRLPPEMRTRRLLSESLACVVRRDHRNAASGLTLKQYLALEHIVVAPIGRPGSYVDSELERLGERRRIVRVVPYFLAAMFLVTTSDAVLTVSERLARTWAPRLDLRTLAPPLALRPYAISMLWHPRLDHDPAHQWLRDVFVRAARTVAPRRHANARGRLRDDASPGGAARRQRPQPRRPADPVSATESKGRGSPTTVHVERR